jgi:hypothetical protein
MDIARATGRETELTPQHDGRIVEDCVLDWANIHGGPFTLILGGPAGGRFEAGSDGPVLEANAIEFARALSGRGVRDEILGTRIVF